MNREQAETIKATVDEWAFPAAPSVRITEQINISPTIGAAFTHSYRFAVYLTVDNAYTLHITTYDAWLALADAVGLRKDDIEDDLRIPHG